MANPEDEVETEENNENKKESSDFDSSESNMDDSKNDVEDEEDLSNAGDMDKEMEMFFKRLENEDNRDRNGYSDLNSAESKMDDSENNVDWWGDGETSDHINSSTELSCDRCDKTFKGSTAKWNLKRHFSSIHEGIKYPCKYEQCGKTFGTETSLQRHYKAIHEGTRYFCELCDKSYTLECHLKSHVKSAHEGRRYICETCGQKFTQSVSLKKHELNIHFGLSYKCDLCGKSLATRNTLNRHKETMHIILDDPKNIHMCEICKKGYKSEKALKVHITSTHRRKKSYVCNLCDAAFVKSERLTDHKFTVHENKKYKCEICDKEYLLKSSLQGHMIDVHKLKKYVCDLCGKGFSRKIALLKHKSSVHEGLKYPCDLCEKAFTQKYTLAAHIRIDHEGKGNKSPQPTTDYKDIEYKCDKCEKVFKGFQAELRFSRHFKGQHEITFQLCEICGESETTKTNLRKHQYEKHVQKDYQCDFCDSSFGNLEKLITHLSKEHPEENTLYKCEACDRMFLDILKLNNHRKRVHKIPTFKCQLCSKSFDDRKGFIQHQSRVHKVKVLAQPNQLTFFVSDNRDQNSQFFCKKCEEYLVFESATDLRVHNATIHGDEAKYFCYECDESFDYRKNWKSHLELVHQTIYYSSDDSEDEDTDDDFENVKKNKLTKNKSISRKELVKENINQAAAPEQKDKSYHTSNETSTTDHNNYEK